MASKGGARRSCGTSGHWCFVKHHWQGCWCQRPVCLQAGWLWQKKSHHSSECQRCALQCRIRKGILQNLQWWDPCRAAEAMHLTACPVSQHQRMERWSLGRKDCKSAGVPSQPCEKVEKGSCQKEAVHAGSHRGAKASHPGVCGFACCLQESNSSSARLSCLWWWPGLQEGQKSQEIQLCFFFFWGPGLQEGQEFQFCFFACFSRSRGLQEGQGFEGKSFWGVFGFIRVSSHVGISKEDGKGEGFKGWSKINFHFGKTKGQLQRSAGTGCKSCCQGLRRKGKAWKKAIHCKETCKQAEPKGRFQKKNLQLREIKKEEEEQGEEEAAAAAESSRPERRPAARASQEGMEAAESLRPERRPWSAAKKVLGKDQAYLMGLFGAKWKLIIGCTKKMGQIYPGGHHSVVLELEKVAMEENMTKEKMTQRKRWRK